MALAVQIKSRKGLWVLGKAAAHFQSTDAIGYSASISTGETGVMSTSLELFILAMVQQGLATPYELKTKAGLSLGSTVPALSRLEKSGLVKASEEGARRSRKFTITAKGAKTLAQCWEGQLAEDHTDLDSILRVAFLAWHHGDAKTCQEFLKRSADGLRGWAGSLHAESERLASKIGTEPDGNSFVWMSKHCVGARALSDAAALAELSVQVARRSGAKRQVKAAKGTR
jgi:DNA-binding PadR family transcriptional regulator